MFPSAWVVLNVLQPVLDCYEATISLLMCLLQVVLRGSAVGDHDTWWNSLPIRPLHGETLPAASEWSPHGETSLLFVRNVSIL